MMIKKFFWALVLAVVLIIPSVLAYNVNCVPVIGDACVYNSNGDKITYDSIGATPPTGLQGSSCIDEYGDYASSHTYAQASLTPPAGRASSDTIRPTLDTSYGYPGIVFTSSEIAYNKDFVDENENPIPGALMTENGIAVSPYTSFYTVPGSRKKYLTQYRIKYHLKFTCADHPPYKVIHTTAANLNYDLESSVLTYSNENTHRPGGTYLRTNAPTGMLGPIFPTESVMDYVGHHPRTQPLTAFPDTSVYVVYQDDTFFQFSTNSFCVENDKEGDYKGNWFLANQIGPSTTNPDSLTSPYRVLGSACSGIAAAGNSEPSTSSPPIITDPIPPEITTTYVNNIIIVNLNFNSATPTVTYNPLQPTSTPTQVCGNGIPEGTETCDLGAGNGLCPKTCSVGCARNVCGAYGNGIIDGIEACDGSNVGGHTCQDDATFSGGPLGCVSPGVFDKSQCIPKTPVDVCYGDLSCALKSSCGLLEYEVVDLSTSSDALMSVAGSTSQKVCCTLPPDPVVTTQGSGPLCGNGNLEDNEICDSNTLMRTNECKNILIPGSTTKYAGGTLKCNPLGGSGSGAACTFDTSGCIPPKPKAVWTDTGGSTPINSARLNDVVRMKVNSLDVVDPNAEFSVFNKNRPTLGVINTDRKPINRESKIALTSTTNNDGTPRTLKDIVGNNAQVGDIIYFNTIHTNQPSTIDLKFTINGNSIAGDAGNPIKSNELLIVDEKTPSGDTLIVDDCKLIEIQGSANDLNAVNDARTTCNRAGRTNLKPQDKSISCVDNPILACEWSDGDGTPAHPPSCNNKVIEPVGSGSGINQCVYKSTSLGCDEKTQLRNINIEIVRKEGTCANCVAKQIKGIPCGRSVLSLPFFGALQFALAVLIIVLIYYFIAKKKVSKKRKK